MLYQEANIAMISEHLRELKKKGQPAAVLLGAGASVSAGIPLANEIMFEIKDRYPSFVSKCEESYQAYMDCLPTGTRRELIGELIDKAQLNFAHLYLATLIKNGFIDTVLTTNFDPLVIKALAFHNIFPAVYDMAISNKYTSGECIYPAVFYLHGQRHGFDLLNSKGEVNRHSKVLKKVFQDVSSQKKCWVVIGYSGINDSVFDRLVELKNFNYGLYWVGFLNNEPTPNVLNSILNQPYTKYIKGHDADSFFLELATELGLPKPQIIDKPFTHLSESINMIAQYKKEDKLADLTKEVKEWVRFAIKGFEEERGFDDIKILIETNVLVRRARDIWIYEKYDEIASVHDIVASSSNAEAKEYLAFAYYNWGGSYYDLKQYDKTIECYNKTLNLKPDFTQALNNIGITYCDLKQYEKAIDYYNKALEIKQDDPDTLNNMGNVYSNLKQYEKAIEYYNRALDFNPDYPEALNNIGNAYSNLKQYEKAIDYYSKAIGLRPDFPEVLSNKGNAHANLKQYDKAIDYHKKALELDPDDFEVLNRIGNVYYRLEQYEIAVEFYNKAINLAPDYSGALKNLANAYLNLKQFDKVLEYYNKGLELDPDDPETLNNMGVTCYDLGQYEKAIEYYKKALSLRPNYPEVLNNMGNAYSNLKQYERAIDYYNKALEQQPDDPDTLNNMGCLYYDLEQYERSIDYFDKTLGLDPDYPSAKHNKKLAYERLEQKVKTEVF